MFKSVEDVKGVDNDAIVALVKNGWQAVVAHLVHEDDLQAYKAAERLVRKYESMAEAMAFQVRDRFMVILDEVEDLEDTYGIDEDEANELIDDFMNSIAGELGQQYNGEWESRPDQFWIPSTC